MSISFRWLQVLSVLLSVSLLLNLGSHIASGAEGTKKPATKKAPKQKDAVDEPEIKLPQDSE